MLGRRHVLPSVISSLTEIMVEGTFPTGTYLVTVHQPVSSDDGDLQKALYGSFLPVPPKDSFQLADFAEYDSWKMPGTIIPLKSNEIVLREGRRRMNLTVTSKGDRPIQVVYDHQTNFRVLNFHVDRLPFSFDRVKSSPRFRPPESVWLFP